MGTSGGMVHAFFYLKKSIIYMKRNLQRLCLFLVALMAAGKGYAYDIAIGMLEYNLDKVNKTAEVVSAIDRGAFHVTVPETIKDYYGVSYTVTSIGKRAFVACDLYEVNLPNTLKRIGDAAFQYRSQLTDIVIPDSVTSIGDNAFQGCSKLSSIRVPKSVKSIGFSAFSDCI